MNKLFVVTIALLLFTVGRVSTSVDYSAQTGRDAIEGRLFIRSQEALSQLMKVAIAELAKKDKAKAEVMKREWETTYRQKYFVYETFRDIGDHYSLNEWLSKKYFELEVILGAEIMKVTHLDSIVTFLYTPQIVFRPCKFPMDSVTIPRIDEYRNHFAYGKKYTGLFPVTTYWVTYAAVTIGSSGTFVYFAGVISSFAERAAKLMAPKLSDKVYHLNCGG